MLYLEEFFIYKIPYMKFVFNTLLALLFLNNVVAQKITPEDIARLPPGKQEQVESYLKKARNSRITAIVLSASAGTILVVGLLVSYANDEWGDGKDPIEAWAPWAIAGVVTGIASIPFFLNINKNRNKARALVFADKGVSMSPHILIPNTRSVGIKFIIPIGK